MAATPVSDTWESGDPYERYVGRWSRQVAPRFLAWLAMQPGRRWLDLGCGTGALSAAVLDHAAPDSVTGVEPSDGFRATAQGNLGGRARLLAGDASAIPLADASVDVVVSALVLNFVPDPRAALIEMARVTGAGGTVAAYVWDYAGRMDLMRHFWDVAAALDPAAARLDEGVRFPLCRADALQAAFVDAGLRQVAVTPIDVATRFADFDDYWQPFLGGQGPAPAYAMALEPQARAALRDTIRTRLPLRADGSVDLLARAWAVRGTVA
ncbi:class I SAM-dependent methyltransferase [Comamonadaceae bacterium G21597-S1]|nr:class I SAM-dependent methyltransferase [Comamonadaceae bacterium G21597-S1]